MRGVPQLLIHKTSSIIKRTISKIKEVVHKEPTTEDDSKEIINNSSKLVKMLLLLPSNLVAVASRYSLLCSSNQLQLV